MRFPNELRRARRAVFSPADHARGTFVFEAEHDPLVLRILNISTGGLLAAFDNTQTRKLDVGDTLHMKVLTCSPAFRCEVDSEVEVCWLLDDRHDGCLGFGCKFLALAPENLAMIEELVASKFAPV